jgi:group I intron endonuclease
MEVLMHYLYRITNQVNGKVYIGQTINSHSRWRDHKREARQEQPKMIIHRAMKKHGIENFVFEIIATCKTQDDANETETVLVKQYESHVSIGKGYNVSNGGNNAPKTEAWRQQARDRWADPAYKARVGNAISQAFAAMSPEDKAEIAKLLSEIQQGKHNSPDTEFKEGHQPSPETVEKTASKLRGVPRPERLGIDFLSPEIRKRVSNGNKDRPAWNKDTIGIMKPNSGSFKPGQQSCFKGLKGRTPNHRKLTDENVLEIVFSMRNKIKTKEELAEQFGVKERVIRDIMAGRTWNHITHIK